MADTIWQSVNIDVSVEVADDAPDDTGESIVKAALEADDRIRYVEITRTTTLIER